jgi:hypothetical protein
MRWRPTSGLAIALAAEMDASRLRRRLDVARALAERFKAYLDAINGVADRRLRLALREAGLS